MDIDVQSFVGIPLFYRVQTRSTMDEATADSWTKSNESDIKVILVHRVPAVEVTEKGTVIMTISPHEIPFVDHGDNP